MRDKDPTNLKDSQLEDVAGGGPHVLGNDLGRVSPEGVGIGDGGGDVIVNTPATDEPIVDPTDPGGGND